MFKVTRNNPFTRIIKRFLGSIKIIALPIFKGFWSLIDIVKDENKSLDFLKALRFHECIFCPHCGMTEITELAHHEYRCKDCLKPFNVKKGTPFEDTRIPIGKWITAIDMENNLTGGINAADLASFIEVNINTALKMLDVIRTIGYDQRIWDLTDKRKGFRKKKSEIYEMDFAFLGGSRKNFTRQQKIRRVNWLQEKIKILGIIMRGGYVKVIIADGMSPEQIIEYIVSQIPKGSRIYTDGEKMFAILAKLGYIIKIVIHSIGEYVRGCIHTNTMENFWAFLKTGLMAAFRNRLTKENAIKFINASVFRFNSREFTREQKVILVLLNIFYHADTQHKEKNMAA